jgi:DNA-binding transcriptional regulator YiaG
MSTQTHSKGTVAAKAVRLQIKRSKSARSKKGHGAKVLRHRLKLSQPDFARLLPISIRSLASLEAGNLPTPTVARRLKELQRLADALAEVMKAEAIGSWLQTANEAFDGLKPLEVIDRGESDRLWQMIYFLRSGTPA